jgi:ABC-2 type transport system ATP-binding protein
VGMLTFHNFIKNYGSFNALNIHDLNIPDGTHWIKGENGSGKTTLFKSLAGLLSFQGDVVLNDGTSAKRNPVHFRQLVNYSEAEPMYPAFVTGKDLIRFVGKAKGASGQQQDEITEIFQINLYADKPCQTYSSGMLKKLSLGLSFLGNPQLIILDEPLITLDRHARQLLFTRIGNEARRGVSFLVSSHQLIDHSELNIDHTYSIENKTLGIK